MRGHGSAQAPIIRFHVFQQYLHWMQRSASIELRDHATYDYHHSILRRLPTALLAVTNYLLWIWIIIQTKDAVLRSREVAIHRMWYRAQV
jgi:hypothetical protein